jgi:hypothetical protein
VAISSQDSGPFGSERQAAAASSWAREARPAGKMREHNLRDLLAACEAAGVELGDYDRRTLEWAAEFEPASCVSLAAMITRAHSDGWQAAMKVANTEIDQVREEARRGLR